MSTAKVVGVAQAALAYGYTTVVPKIERNFGNAQGKFEGYITMEEQHSDEVQITDHPIEQGAAITDHAFKLPAELTVKIAWSNSPSGAGLLGGIRGLLSTVTIVQSNIMGTSANQVRQIYEKLLASQLRREPMLVLTGKRQYPNMLIKSIVVTTDKLTENMLAVTVTFREIIRVKTTIITVESVPSANQKEPQATSSPVNNGTKQLTPAAKANGPAADRAINPTR